MRNAPAYSSSLGIPPFDAFECRPDDFEYMDDYSIEPVRKIWDLVVLSGAILTARPTKPRAFCEVPRLPLYLSQTRRGKDVSMEKAMPAAHLFRARSDQIKFERCLQFFLRPLRGHFFYETQDCVGLLPPRL
jgi:hypothetical protein